MAILLHIVLGTGALELLKLEFIEFYFLLNIFQCCFIALVFCFGEGLLMLLFLLVPFNLHLEFG